MRRGSTALLWVLCSAAGSAFAQDSANARAGCPADQADQLRLRGESQQARNSDRAAAEAFEQSLQCNPSQPLVQYRLGLAYRSLGEQRKAYRALSTAVDGGFRNAGALFHTVEAAFASREFAAAAGRSRELMAVAGKSSALMTRLGRLLLTRLYYRDAVRAFELACQPDSKDLQPCFYLALARHLLNEPEGAIPVLLRLTEAAPGGESLTLLAAAYGQRRDYENAGRTFANAERNDPGSPHILLNWALMMLERNEMDRAEEMLTRFKQMKLATTAKVFFHVSQNSCPTLFSEVTTPKSHVNYKNEFAAYLENLAVQMMDQYHYAAAVQLLRLAARNGDESADLFFAAGRSCFNMEPHSRTAVDFLRQAVLRGPRNAEAWHLLGRALLLQGKHPQAIAALEQAVLIQPNASRHNSLGKAYYVAGGGSESANERASAIFQLALSQEPANAMAHYELGRLFLKIAQFQRARTHLEQAVNAEPDFYEAYYSLGLACTRMGAHQEARTHLTRSELLREAARQHSVLGGGYLSEGHVQ